MKIRFEEFLNNNGDITTDIIDYFNKNDLKYDSDVINTFFNNISDIEIERIASFSFEISTLKGQCSTMLVHEHWVWPTNENVDLFFKTIDEIATGLGFSAIMFTDCNNYNIDKLLQANKDYNHIVQDLYNKRTKNNINFYIKFL